MTVIQEENKRQTIYASEVLRVFFLATVFSLVDKINIGKTKKVEQGLPESILEPPGNIFQIPHPASASCLSALGLLSPHIRANLGGWVTT